MSGHSKWHQIRHKKAIIDARKGKLFTKLIKEITVAAKQGGGNPETNPRLRLAIQNAKAANMPWENIERAIKRGTGELPGVAYEEVVYEGYGPGGVALYIESTTDNKNRTVAEIRNILNRHNGSLGEAGSVAWIFERKGVIQIPKEYDEDTILAIILEAGADDLKSYDTFFEVITAPENLEQVREALEKNNVKIDDAKVRMLPKTTVKVEGKDAQTLLKLLEALEDHDDVQNVYSNFEIDDTVLAEYSKQMGE
ncbi:MAG: YebC/PmpR family DNA-binding transcriptional regulator [Candidatus Kryptonium sp.]|nr:YebC/PmpR family DNA-binding transcriptional regulator [Candidatus Kryptonium sp.]MCX7762181.1 YebC/PmpR family DNA-binding transcriptional regulator [Candidatus Kryptonium sp.]MDW8108969.1 YebC/PmpR family DNA-binding transcriptional regulator [Candidatus Kryptonium sp.]